MSPQKRNIIELLLLHITNSFIPRQKYAFSLYVCYAERSIHTAEC